jgi:succinyldiaminopimelate transaminase
MSDTVVAGFVPPPYPFSLLGGLSELAAAHAGGMVDLSIGTPCDPPARSVVEALGSSGTERGYPPSIGSEALRSAASGWMERRFGVGVPAEDVLACVGTKELVSSMPQWLRLRSPDRDTVLYPSVSYPTYEMGAILSGCRAVPVEMEPGGGLRLDTVSEDDAGRALCLWVNSPGNPAGQLEDLGAAAKWGRAHGVPVLSDECYVELTWDGAPNTILNHGSSEVLAVHSLSKRSNLAGLRVGFVAGDHDLVSYLGEVRKHAGLMVPGPAQAAAVVALEDDAHTEDQRQIYHDRLVRLASVLSAAGVPAELPGGSFYLWVNAGDALPEEGETKGWALARWLAENAGVLASPGQLYGPGGNDYVRLAVVQPMERIELAGERLAAAAPWPG